MEDRGQQYHNPLSSAFYFEMAFSNNQPGELSSLAKGREFVVSGQELGEWRQRAKTTAIAAGIDPTEVDWLLQEWAGLNRLGLRLESFKQQATVSLKCSLESLETLWQQRVHDRVPLQYLIGSAPWRQFSLQVSPAVLIPRPETEMLIDLAVQAVGQSGVPTSKPHHWVDLGTGSGAIALGLATAFPDAQIHAVDLSAAALAVAHTNASAYQLNDHIQFYRGSWFEPLAHLQGQLRGIVSNPPYIPTGMVPDLQVEVARHEPHLALDGGVDGLEWIRHIISLAPAYLQPDGILLFEMMAGQAIAVADLLHQQGSYRAVQIYPDLAGIERFALAYRI